MYDISCFDEESGAASAPATDLGASFHNTSYIVHLGHANIPLRIGKHNPQLDVVLAQKGFHEWAWITAANPGAQKVSEKVNAARYREFLHLVFQEKLTYLTADAVPDVPGWPIEPGLLIFGISLERALEVGRKFGQLAILAGIKGHVPLLHYCENGE